jgi:hypothetical protein
VRLTSKVLKNALVKSASTYNPEDDSKILKIAANHKGYLTAKDLHIIFEWKLQPNHFISASRQLVEYDAIFKGEIKRRTSLIASAESDHHALSILRGLPQMKTGPSVAVASCVLMVLDMNRFTVMDRRANETLVALKETVTKQGTASSELRELRKLLSSFEPPADCIARSQDWPTYMAICRELSQATGLALREIDRALYSASGNLGLTS